MTDEKLREMVAANMRLTVELGKSLVRVANFVARETAGKELVLAQLCNTRLRMALVRVNRHLAPDDQMIFCVCQEVWSRADVASWKEGVETTERRLDGCPLCDEDTYEAATRRLGLFHLYRGPVRVSRSSAPPAMTRTVRQKVGGGGDVSSDDSLRTEVDVDQENAR
jgi:hypothetical protein